MQNFQDTFETRKRSFISAFFICMAVPIMFYILGWITFRINSSIFKPSFFLNIKV